MLRLWSWQSSQRSSALRRDLGWQQERHIIPSLASTSSPGGEGCLLEGLSGGRLPPPDGSWPLPAAEATSPEVEAGGSDGRVRSGMGWGLFVVASSGQGVPGVPEVFPGTAGGGVPGVPFP